MPAAPRLSHTDEIASVLNFKCQSSSAHLNIAVKPNGLPYFRVAVVSPKRTSPRAVARNYQKRLVRALIDQGLPSLHLQADIVVRVKRAFDRSQASVLKAEIKDLLLALNHKLKAL